MRGRVNRISGNKQIKSENGKMLKSNQILEYKISGILVKVVDQWSNKLNET